MTQPTLREEFVSFAGTYHIEGPYDPTEVLSAYADWWLLHFQAQLEVLAERVGKEADLLEFDTHAYGNPQTRADHNSMQFGKKLAFENASSLIRTFSKELK